MKPLKIVKPKFKVSLKGKLPLKTGGGDAGSLSEKDPPSVTEPTTTHATTKTSREDFIRKLTPSQKKDLTPRKLQVLLDTYSESDSDPAEDNLSEKEEDNFYSLRERLPHSVVMEREGDTDRWDPFSDVDDSDKDSDYHVDVRELSDNEGKGDSDDSSVFVASSSRGSRKRVPSARVRVAGIGRHLGGVSRHRGARRGSRGPLFTVSPGTQEEEEEDADDAGWTTDLTPSTQLNFTGTPGL